MLNVQWKNANRQTRLYLIATVILLVGLSSALPIYFLTENEPESTLIHEFENSKMYTHNLEVYGGKLNVFADDFIRWFVGLWYGRSLAYTVACLSIFISLGCFFVAYNLPSGSKSESESESVRERTKS